MLSSLLALSRMKNVSNRSMCTVMRSKCDLNCWVDSLVQLLADKKSNIYSRVCFRIDRQVGVTGGHRLILLKL